VADPGISEWGGGRQWKARGLGAALKPPLDSGQRPGGVQGAKPPSPREADEFLHVKCDLIKMMI
jgi:hypothetical protein